MGTVVIDANAIVRGSWHLDSAAWQFLRYRGKSGLDRIVVPEIVVREVVGKYRTELTAATAKARKAASELRRLHLSVPAMPDPVIDDHAAGYESGLRAVLLDAKAEIPDPPVDVLALVDRAVARRRPFNENGDGFRDAAVWEQVAFESTRPYVGVVTFISDDGDFGPKGELHSDLLSDLAERREPGRVKRFANVGDYVRAVGGSNPRVLAEVAQRVEEQATDLSARVRAAVEAMDWETDTPRGRVLVQGAYDPVSITVTGVTTSEESPSAVVELDVQVESDLYVEPWAAARYPDYLTGSASLTLTGSLAFNQDTKVLDDLELELPFFDVESWLDWHGD